MALPCRTVFIQNGDRDYERKCRIAAAMSLLITFLAQLRAISDVRKMNLETLTRERSA
ncbi:MAG: hypothetical protein HYU64_06060 [Armatimonadetes bacterium]|nr:hypothetical protein [Armatimonadota bacterium]